LIRSFVYGTLSKCVYVSVFTWYGDTVGASIYT